MTRIERITNMESLFDKSEEVVKRLEVALEDFAKLEHDIAKLEAYYNSPQPPLRVLAVARAPNPDERWRSHTLKTYL